MMQHEFFHLLSFGSMHYHPRVVLQICSFKNEGQIPYENNNHKNFTFKNWCDSASKGSYNKSKAEFPNGLQLPYKYIFHPSFHVENLPQQPEIHFFKILQTNGNQVTRAFMNKAQESSINHRQLGKPYRWIYQHCHNALATQDILYLLLVQLWNQHLKNEEKQPYQQW